MEMGTARKIFLTLALVVVLAAIALSGDVISPVDQSEYYRGTPEECRTTVELRGSTQADFMEGIPLELGSPITPLYFAIGVHIEPHREYLDEQRYRLDRERLLKLAELVERHGGRLTIQAQSPFTTEALQLGDQLFRELAEQGHELALHFHEDAHLPGANGRPVGDWVAALRREIGLIERLSGRPVETWSGGNLYRHLFEAAAQAGLKVNINYKDPRTQGIDPRFLILTPWRPAGAESIEARTSHDPAGPIIYIPSGVWPAHCPGAEAVPHPYNYAALDYVTVALRSSLNALAEGKVNTFIATVHPGDFAGPEDDEQELAVWEEWLTKVIDPLAASGRLRWGTTSEMARAFESWEAAQVQAQLRQEAGAGLVSGPPPAQNLILISWDGVQRAHLMELSGQGLLPNLAALAQQGTALPMAIADHATDTKAGHAEMLSGYGPEVTGVYSNLRYQAIPEGLTLFERLKGAFGPQIATIAITGKRTNLIEILPNALPELDFALIRNATAEQNGPVMLWALESLRDRPFFAFFHFSDPDHAGHAYGENSREYSAAIRLCDHWLGEIMAKLRELGISEKTLIYVTTDHGFDEGRKSHLNAPEIWLVTDDPSVTQTQSRSAEQRDIAPTILERFGFELDQIEPPLSGRSLLSGAGPIPSVTSSQETGDGRAYDMGWEAATTASLNAEEPVYVTIMTHVEGDRAAPEGSPCTDELFYQTAPLPPPGRLPQRNSFALDVAGTELLHEILQRYTDSFGGKPRLFIEPAGEFWQTEADPVYGGKLFRKYDWLELGYEFGIQGHGIYYSGQGSCWYESPRTEEGIRRKLTDLHRFAEQVYHDGQKVNAGLTLTPGAKIEGPVIGRARAEWVYDHVAYELGYRISFEDHDGHLEDEPPGIDNSRASYYLYEADYGDGVKMLKIDFNGSVRADCRGNTPRCETPEEAIARLDRTLAARAQDPDPGRVYYFAFTVHSNGVWTDFHMKEAGLPMRGEGAGLTQLMEAIQERVNAGAKIKFVTPGELEEVYQ